MKLCDARMNFGGNKRHTASYSNVCASAVQTHAHFLSAVKWGFNAL